MESADIAAYLSGGILVKMLEDHAGIEVWICQSKDGRLVHTFTKPDVGVGGHQIPWMLLHEGKIFRPREGEAIEFLQGFGLAQTEAESVILAVGRAP